MLTVSVLLISCTTLKKAGITSLATGAAVTVATALSSGATVPILAAPTTAFVASAVTDVTIGATGNKIMNECAGDNFWTLLGQIIEMGGWFLLLLLLVPMVIGWVLPGPLERKKKS